MEEKISAGKVILYCLAGAVIIGILAVVAMSDAAQTETFWIMFAVVCVIVLVILFTRYYPLKKLAQKDREPEKVYTEMYKSSKKLGTPIGSFEEDGKDIEIDEHANLDWDGFIGNYYIMSGLDKRKNPFTYFSDESRGSDNKIVFRIHNQRLHAKTEDAIKKAADIAEILDTGRKPYYVQTPVRIEKETIKEPEKAELPKKKVK